MVLNRTAMVVSRIPKESTPKWFSFFSGYVDLKKLGQNSSTGALFIALYKERFFVLSFGVAYHQIKFENIERDFGLKTTLNCIDENSIRCVDKSSLEAQPKESREQAGLVTDIQFFGIDVERDLLKAVTGTPKKKYETLGGRITGRDPVKFSAAVNLCNISNFFDRLLDVYDSEEYKDGVFSWVDHIGEVKDNHILKKLNDDLVQRLSVGEYEKVWTSVPEIVDWENTLGFKCVSMRNCIRSDVKIRELMASIPDEEIDIDVLKRKKIYSVDANGDVIKPWSAYRFLYAESVFENDTYLLNNGKWYKVDQDYSKTIDDYFNSIEIYAEELPEYNDDTETIYNERVANENENVYYLLDRKNVKISATASSVEPCDLFKYPDQFIHVKRYGGSSVLSHLFNQGLVSGELFKREPEFKKKIIEEMGDKAHLTSFEKPDHKFSVVYAIISESDKDLSIPFFSKVSLKHATNRLVALGYKVFLSKVSVDEYRKKTTKHPTKGRRK